MTRTTDDARPYAGTSGHSGGTSSRDRAVREDEAGITGARQAQVYRLVRDSYVRGVTDPEVQQTLGVGHGASSGALTRLHRVGKIVRLRERRNRNEVYVLPERAGDRPTVPYRPHSSGTQQAALRDALAEIDDLKRDVANLQRANHTLSRRVIEAEALIRRVRDDVMANVRYSGYATKIAQMLNGFGP